MAGNVPATWGTRDEFAAQIFGAIVESVAVNHHLSGMAKNVPRSHNVSLHHLFGVETSHSSLFFVTETVNRFPSSFL